MATPRSLVVDEAVTPWYHCTSRCVRRAFLCGEGFAHRKQWIEDRLQELVEIFAIDCGSFAIMDNHLHVLLRLDSSRTQGWSNEEVARRWLRLFPLRGIDGQALPIAEARVQQMAVDGELMAKLRRRLGDLGWFMKCLKEPLARMANKEDGSTGAFWEGRFRCVSVLDEASLLATAAYIDLNPVAAGIAPTPEESPHTSLRTRLDQCRAEGTLEGLRDELSTQTRDPAQEAGGWLLPIDDHRAEGSVRGGLVAGLTLSCYLRLVDWASRLVRAVKAHVPAAVSPIFARLKADPAEWGAMVSALLAGGPRRGCHFGNPERLAAAASTHGRRWHRNQVPRMAHLAAPAA